MAWAGQLAHAIAGQAELSWRLPDGDARPGARCRSGPGAASPWRADEARCDEEGRRGEKREERMAAQGTSPATASVAQGSGSARLGSGSALDEQQGERER